MAIDELVIICVFGHNFYFVKFRKDKLVRATKNRYRDIDEA
jgi:hypothetical protein